MLWHDEFTWEWWHSSNCRSLSLVEEKHRSAQDSKASQKSQNSGVCVSWSCRLSAELCAANTHTLQPSASTSIKVWGGDGCTQVPALPCSLRDAQWPRGTWCHFEDWLEHMLCSIKSPEAPCATLTLLWNTSLPLFVSLSRRRVWNRVRSSPVAFSLHQVLYHMLSLHRPD